MSDIEMSDFALRNRKLHRPRTWSESVELMEVEVDICSRNNKCVQGLLIGVSSIVGFIWVITMIFP